MTRKNKTTFRQRMIKAQNDWVGANDLIGRMVWRWVLNAKDKGIEKKAFIKKMNNMIENAQEEDLCEAVTKKKDATPRKSPRIEKKEDWRVGRSE